LLEAYLWPPDSIPTWQILRVDRAIYDRIKNESVRLKGELVADFYRRGDPTWMPVGGRATAPGVGRCSSAIVEAQLGEEMLKVNCESPAEIPLFTHVRLLDTDTGKEWSQRLGGSVTWAPYPRTTWLSPVNRRDTFFHLRTEDVSDREGSRWLVPSDVLATARLAVIAEAAAGCTVGAYDISGVALSKFVVEPTR